MKLRSVLLNLFIVGATALYAQTNAGRDCLQENHHEQLMEDPDYAASFQERMQRMQDVLREREGNRSMNCTESIPLPMAFHFQGFSNPDVACLQQLALNQLQILNDDYQGVNADINLWTNGAAASFPGINNGESCIQFCLPTTGHPDGFGLSEGDLAVTINQTNGSFSGDWSGYINVFVRNIGALGFSPLGGAGDGDGVTVDNRAFGAGSGCPGAVPNAPFDLGRTLTHELGHYLGLPHIWGGGCGQDDGVSDTPNSSGSYGGCPSVGASSCGSVDMHMNYLDYVNDACMYMYSEGQIAVQDAYALANLQNVIANADRCGDGGGGGGGGGPTAMPEVNFSETFVSFQEGSSGCLSEGSRIVPLAISISEAPDEDAEVTVNAAGSAVEGEDYNLLNNVVIFPAGSTEDQVVELEIIEDLNMEDDEFISLSFTLNANGGATTIGNQPTAEIEVTNDDVEPTAFITEVATMANIDGGFADFNLGPQSTMHFFDQLTGRIMLSVTNSTNHDYGCTNVSIDRADEASPGATTVVPDNVAFVTDKTYFISPENDNFNNLFTVRLYYTDEEINGFLAESGGNAMEVRMVKSGVDIQSEENTMELVVPSFGSFGDDRYYEASYRTGMGGFAMAVEPATLPVELLSFTAAATTKAIDLAWVTALEQQNEGFTVLRRTAAQRDFSTLGWVPGAMAPAGATYAFTDETATAGIQYFYQLRQRDTDGTETSSLVVSARIEGLSDLVRAYPNPANDELTVVITNPEAGELRLTNADGRVLRQRSFAGGNTSLTLNLTDMPTGVYFLAVETRSETMVRRVVRR